MSLPTGGTTLRTVLSNMTPRSGPGADVWAATRTIPGRRSRLDSVPESSTRSGSSGPSPPPRSRRRARRPSGRCASSWPSILSRTKTMSMDSPSAGATCIRLPARFHRADRGCARWRPCRQGCILFRCVPLQASASAPMEDVASSRSHPISWMCFTAQSRES